jgi:hypothetical protein
MRVTYRIANAGKLSDFVDHASVLKGEGDIGDERVEPEAVK